MEVAEQSHPALPLYPPTGPARGLDGLLRALAAIAVDLAREEATGVSSEQHEPQKKAA